MVIKPNNNQEGNKMATATKKKVTKIVKATKPRIIRIKKETPILNNIAQIPQRGTLANYKNRTIYGRTDFEWFDYSLEHGYNVLIESPTGAGKSMAVEAYAESRRMAHVTFPFEGAIDSAKMYGKLLPSGNNWKWNDGIFTDIARHGGVCELGELTYAREQDSASLLQVLRERILTLVDNDSEIIHLPKNVLFIATTNPNYAGTRELNPAMRNRFGTQLVWDYDTNIESQLVVSESLLQMAQSQRNEGSIRTPISTNMLIEFENTIKHLGLVPAIASFVNHFDAKRERSAIKIVVDTWKDNIEQEVLAGTTRKKSTSTSVEDLREVSANADMSEFGQQGVDWDYEDEVK